MSGHPFHPGELAAQERFLPNWDEEKARRLGRIIGRALDDEKALFVEGLPWAAIFLSRHSRRICRLREAGEQKNSYLCLFLRGSGRAPRAGGTS